jgi:hypothetical protein
MNDMMKDLASNPISKTRETYDTVFFFAEMPLFYANGVLYF